eukprot:2756475-Rhodomonas_salina.1
MPSQCCTSSIDFGFITMQVRDHPGAESALQLRSPIIFNLRECKRMAGKDGMKKCVNNLSDKGVRGYTEEQNGRGGTRPILAGVCRHTRR